MSASPFTSQGYPFSKDLASYDAESLGRAFFADGLVTDFGGPRLFDNARLTVKANPPRHAPLVYAGREVAVYVYTGDQEAEITDKYARLVLKPHEAGIFAWRREGLVTFRIKLGSSLLALARVPSAAAMSQLRAVRTEAALNGQAWTASWLLGLFALDGKPLLDPLNVMTLDELAKSANPIISRHEQPTYLRGGILLRYKEGAIDVVVGLFFDGTGNNRYCTELIYNELLVVEKL